MYFNQDNFDDMEFRNEDFASGCPEVDVDENGVEYIPMVPVCPYYQMCSQQQMFYRQPGPNVPPPGHPGYGPAGIPGYFPMEEPEYGPSGGNMPPAGPPPSVQPSVGQAKAQPKAVSPGSIRPCTYRYVYIWLDNGRSFWAWLTRVDRRTAAGWRWTGRRWVYFAVDLRRIDEFICY